MSEDRIEHLMEMARAEWQKGISCPSADRLAAFQRGWLEKSEEVQIRDHVSFCGRCELIIVRSTEAERIPLRVGPVEPVIAEIGHRNPVLIWAGYAVALLLLWPAWNGFVSGQGKMSEVRLETAPPRPEFSAISPFGTSLGGADVNRRGTAAPQATNQVEAVGSFFLLRFWIPTKSTGGFRYIADIMDASGSNLAAATALNGCDASGSCVLMCDIRAFARGKYSLEVRELDARGNVSAGPFRFTFERR